MTYCPNGIQIHQPRVGATRLPWETVPTNSSTLKELNQIHHRTDATPSDLFAIQSPTQRSPIASANVGLNDSTPLELVLADTCD